MLKKMLIFIIALGLLLTLHPGDSEAKIKFSGIGYAGGFQSMAGVGFPVGGQFWNFDYATVSFDGTKSVGIEAAYLYDYKDGGLFGGVLVGGGAEWRPPKEGSLNYLNEVVGGILGYKSLLGWAKYRLQLEQGTGYKNNFSFFIGTKTNF